jgi:hypothetical protein
MAATEATEAGETASLETGTESRARWSGAVVASLAAGIVMGIPMQFVMGIMPTVGALYGWESVAVGWVAHLFHSVVFGVIFAGVVSLGPLEEYASRLPASAGVGVGYGVALWLFGAVVAMPLWLESAGLPNPGVPNLNPMSLGGHVVYGALLGALLPVVVSAAEEINTEPDGRRPTWLAALGAGVVAGVVMGVPMQFNMGIMPAVAALYGLEGAAAGWGAHVFHSVVFALVFAGVSSLPVAKRYVTFPSSVPVAVGYGVAVWVFGSVYAMPLWLSSIGFEYAPAVPNIAPMSLLAHVLFGVALGVAYPALLSSLR